MKIDWLQKEIHENAKAHGWYDTEPSFDSVIANIHAEISEAWEEYRNGHGLDETYYAKCEKCGGNGFIVNNSLVSIPQCYACSGTGHSLKPEGIPSELADIVIRILDSFEYSEKTLSEPTFYEPAIYALLSFEEFICGMHVTLDAPHFEANADAFSNLVWEISMFCEANGINLEQAISQKHEYNKTRPYKHGGKVV